MASLSYTYLVLVLMAVSCSVTSLSCYSCTASVGQGYRCENLSLSGSNIPYNTCYYQDAVCAKYVVEYGDSLMIHRNCQHRDICGVLSSRFNNPYNRLLDCQICSDANYCNSANRDNVIPALFIVVTVLSITLFYQ